MSFVNPVAGFIPNSEFVYTTSTVNADDVNCTNLTAVNANITNLVTTTFSPININGTNLSVVTASIGTANIGTAIIDVSYTAVSNNENLISNNAFLDNIKTDEIKLNDKDGINEDDALIYREGNELNFIGKVDPTGIGVDILFYPNQKLGTPPFKILRDQVLCEAVNMKITNVLTTKFTNVELLGFIDDTIANRKSYIQLVNGEFKFIGGTGINTDFLFYNKLTDGPILIINSTGIDINGEVDATTIKGNISQNLIAGDGITLSTTSGITKIEAIPLPDPLSVNQLNCDIIDSRLYLFSDSSNYDDKSRIYRQGNILKIAGGEVAGDENASIFFYTGPPTGTPQLKIDKNNNKVTVPDFVANDIFSLRATITTFNSSSVSSAFVGSDNMETKILTFNDETTSNASYFERVDDKFRFVGSDGAVAVDWEFYKTDGINALMKIQAANDRVIIDGTLQANISPSIKAGTGISFSVNPSTGVTEITNTASVEDPLTINTLNSTTINNSSTITTNKTATKYIDIIDINNANISTFSKTNNILNLFGTSTSTPIDINFFTKLYTSNAPILQLLGTDNKVLINGLLEADTITADISNNLVAGDGIQLDTTAGVTTITNTGLVVSPLTIDTINSTTINNSAKITTDDMTVNGTLIAPYIEGFTQSTEYAFRVSSNSGGQTLATNTIINFNLVQLETPPSTATEGYDTSLKQYKIPTSGIYAFGFNMYYNNANFTLRIGIYKNNVLIASGGNNSSTADSVSTVVDCEEGEWVNIKVVSGGGDTVPSNCSFWGNKLVPANNIIDSTTNLNVKNLTTTNNINGATITGDLLVGLAGINSITDISANGIVYGNTGNFSSSVITSDLTVNTSIQSPVISCGTLTATGLISSSEDITTSAAVSAYAMTASFINGDISNNLQAGPGIDLTTASGITTITNVQPYLSLSRTSNYIPGIANFYYVSYNSQLNDGSGTFSYSNSAITVNATGRYVISGSGNIDNVSYNDRVNLRIRLVVNGGYSSFYPEAFGYARHFNYVPYATACYTDFVISLTAGDVVQNRLDISKGNTTGFNSTFDGINIASGCNCMIRRIS